MKGRRAGADFCAGICLVLLLLAAGPAGAAMRAGEVAPGFSLPASSGGIVSLAETLRGGPVLVGFVSSHCVPCDDSLATLKALYDRGSWGGQVATLLVAVSDRVGVERLAASGKVDPRMTLLRDTVRDGRFSTAESYGVFGTPSFFLVDADGTVRAVWVGRLGVDLVADAVEGLLAGSLAATVPRPPGKFPAVRQDPPFALPPPTPVSVPPCPPRSRR